GAVLAEDLDAIVLPVADVDEAVLGDLHAVNGVRELLWCGPGRIVGRSFLIARRLSVGAPVALVGAGVGIKHDDAMIAVTVNEDFIGRWVDFRIGRPAQAARIGAACLRSGFADLQHELSVLSEFQDVTVVVAIAADPDEAFGIDIDAVLVFEPVVALAWPTPGLEQIAV